MALTKTPEEIKILGEGGKILGKILALLAKNVRPGISTLDLDTLARQEIKKAGAIAAFPGYQIAHDSPPYPAALCTSIDDEVVHCIPRESRILQEGQIIGLDLGIKYQGLYTDAARTVAVGKVSDTSRKLVEVTRQALQQGITKVKPGRTIGDVAHAIEQTAKAAGFGVIRDLVGHGVGHSIHEPPQVPNYGRPGTLGKLVPGMVIAIEPMFTTGGHQIRFLDDGWTVVTADGSLSAHFEDTVVVTPTGCRVLTC